MKRRQEHSDKQADRDEQRKMLHRKARKDAYSALLVAYAGFDEAINKVWLVQADTPTDDGIPAAFHEAEQALLDLRPAVSAVALEGPPAVVASPNQPAVERHRVASLDQFVSAAREALGGNAAGFG
ncbi:hypothetical protein [Streptacidiphilus neutrinimicus]|uniref:hypothetical protein n=1 Tax=Streptacidiphilus neutrinimicus TaxID=105420 RepID=UPI0005A62C8B|nr:hypothetical protein [Streptacidiphilus neutrinimicus]